MKKLFNVIIILFLFTGKVFSQTACQFAYLPVAANAYSFTITQSTVDVNGNLIYLGKMLGRADLDPSPAIGDTAFSYGSYNYFISKVSPDGHLKWVKFFNQNSSIAFFEFVGVRVNSNNEIVVVGNYYGMIDFDFSSGVDTLRSHLPTYPDYFVAKYDSSGNHIWAFSIGNSNTSVQANVNSMAFTINQSNQILISANPGSSTGVDLDPGVAVHNSISSKANVVCYNNAGNYVWNNSISQNSSYAVLTNNIEVDANGNSYLMSVGYYELTVTKFDASGVRLWDKKIGSFAANARVNPLSILVEKATGSFYVAGTFGGNVDFDPGPGTNYRASSSGSYQDGFIAKYDADMNVIWVNAYSGNVEFGKYSLDYLGNDIVAVGKMKGTINFGNGLTLSSPSVFAGLYLKLNSLGVVQNAYVLNGFSAYNTINTTSNQSYYITGSVIGTVDVDPTPAIINLTSGNTNNFFASHGTIPPAVSTLNLKFYLEGFYNYGGLMKPVLANQGQGNNTLNTDSIIVELRSSTFPYNLIATNTSILRTNGNMTSIFSPAVSGNYYVVVKQRNHLATWSANPIAISSITNYDFTTAANKAYGNNMIEVEPGVWAMYCGDVAKDENIDLLDATLLDSDINQFLFGYYSTDLNGDGNVDLLDMSLAEYNMTNFIFSNHP